MPIALAFRGNIFEQSAICSKRTDEELVQTQLHYWLDQVEQNSAWCGESSCFKCLATSENASSQRDRNIKWSMQRRTSSDGALFGLGIPASNLFVMTRMLRCVFSENLSTNRFVASPVHGFLRRSHRSLLYCLVGIHPMRIPGNQNHRFDSFKHCSNVFDGVFAAPPTLSDGF